MMDMLFEKRLALAGIRRALAATFRVSPKDVQVGLLEDFIKDPVGRSSPVLAEVVNTKGEYLTMVKLEVTPQHYDRDYIGFARRLCAEVGSAVLIPDKSRNPYSWILVEVTGQAMPVQLDAEAMDDREEYRVARVASGERVYEGIPVLNRAQAVAEVSSGNPKRMVIGLLAMAYHDPHPEEVEPHFLQHARDKVASVRAIALECLDLACLFNGYASDRGLQAVVAGLDDTAPEVASNAWDAFERFLMKRAKDAAAGHVLPGNPELADPLARAFALADVVGRWPTPEEGWTLLLRGFEDASPLVRAAAYWACCDRLKWEEGSVAHLTEKLQRAVGRETEAYAVRMANTAVASARYAAKDAGGS